MSIILLDYIDNIAINLPYLPPLVSLQVIGGVGATNPQPRLGRPLVQLLSLSRRYFSRQVMFWPGDPPLGRRPCLRSS